MKILILGSNGLVGNTITRYFFEKENYQTIAILRDYSKLKLFQKKFHQKFLVIENILDYEKTKKIIKKCKARYFNQLLGNY